MTTRNLGFDVQHQQLRTELRLVMGSVGSSHVRNEGSFCEAAFDLSSEQEERGAVEKSRFHDTKDLSIPTTGAIFKFDGSAEERAM